MKTKIFTNITLLFIGLVLFQGTNVYAMGNQDAKPSQAKNNEFNDGKSAVYSGRFETAIQILKKVISDEPRNADAHNYLGYSYRKLGKLDLAASSYFKVFAINPDHKGALEYQGELFLKQGNLSAAKLNLEKLAKLCSSNCKEYAELKRAIADFIATR